MERSRLYVMVGYRLEFAGAEVCGAHPSKIAKGEAADIRWVLRLASPRSLGREGEIWMTDRVKIAYRDFYDVPRMLIVSRRGLKLLLDSPFDDSLDKYSPTYKVYVLPTEVDEHTLKSWEALPQMAMKSLGEIPVNQVAFDATKRAEVDTGVIDSLLDSHQVHT